MSICVRNLDKARDRFCDLGTRKTKLRLNKLAKTDIYAKALRIALEIEDKNIVAKKYRGGNINAYTYSAVNYFAKEDGIKQLIEICKTQQWTSYGIQKSASRIACHLL